MDDHFGKLSEDSDLMYKRCGPTALPQQNFSMHVAVPVSNPNAMYQAGGNLGSQALAAATASLNESGMLSPPQASLHRNVGSGGGSQRPTSAGSAGNGFVNPRGSPSLLSTPSGNGLGKILPTKSPPPPGGNMGMGSRKPDLRVVIPPSSKGMMPPLVSKEHTAAHQFHQPEDLGGWQSEEEEMDLNTQRISSSQSTQLLATPVVSVTTPSLPPQGLVYSGMPTAYNPAEYSLSSAEISSLQGFSSPSLSLGSMSAWQQHQLGQAALNSLVGGSHLPQGSNLSISTSQSINIKSEPISPPRERVTPSGFPPQQQQPQQGSSRQEVLGRSPADSLSSSCSSYDGSDREDHRADFHSPLGLGRPPAGSEDRESPSVKRLRMDTWVT
ncbi:myocyte enhancer factor [Crenichthys baileyi]|uniref:Myocyte enhancer factor n=1 Tax=Crenichthys baileyi TaxID=28760 RepID=A0AAV9R061_9TELE